MYFPKNARLDKTRLLFLVILIEGYVVLACELLAIRELIPFVGSGTDTVSIVISAVLLPLAAGYHFGGGAYKRQFARARALGQTGLSIRKILLRNIITALFLLTVGLSYICMEAFFTRMEAWQIENRLLQTSLYSALFLVIPVFLLGQTVPLISNYFSRRRLSEITGRMLFFSTTGSFLGSVFSTIVLMSYIGVHNTVIVTLGLLCFLLLLLARKSLNFEILSGVALFCLLWMLNNDDAMKSYNIVSNNAYNMVSIEHPDPDSIVFNVNRSFSSKLTKNPDDKYRYVKYIEVQFIEPLMNANNPPRDILILGAGGFTLGLDDTVNHYTFVDIDKDLKATAEKHFLGQKLTPNKTFAPVSARAFLRDNDKQYDLVVIDVYTNVVSVPMESTTREFLLDVKKAIKPNGVVVANVISSPAMKDKFSVRYANTFASVFPAHTRQVINYFDWYPDNAAYYEIGNVLYIAFNTPLAEDRTIYTDDKNTYSLDVGVQ